MRTVLQGTKFFDKHFRYFMVAPAVIALALVIVYPLAVAQGWPAQSHDGQRRIHVADVGLGNFTRLCPRFTFRTQPGVRCSTWVQL